MNQEPTRPRRRWLMFCAAAVAGMGCAPGSPAGQAPLANETLRQAPVRPAVVAQQLVSSPANPAPETNTTAMAGAVVDARVLIITGNGSDSDSAAIQSTLQYLGTPFDVLNATTGPTLTADMLASGTHGKYNAIFLDIGDLSVGGASAFTTDEWTTLSTYEAQFSVRRVSLYTSPTTAYGLSDVGEVDPGSAPVTMTCTAAGTAAFVGANCANPIVVDQGWVYPAAVADGTTTPLLVDGAGNVYAATHTYSDGREALALTFAQATYYNSYLELAYGLVNWATRGLFIGERHVYAVPQVDDLFLYSALYTGPKASDRITDADLQAFADWQATKRAQPQFAGFRAGFMCNGAGSQSIPGDPLTAKAIALGSTFAWVNHTWDHPELDGMSYADVLSEFTRNDAYLMGLPLAPYMTVSAVTPNISGLGDANAMQAIYDAGIRYIVSDTSVQGQDNPSPNIGIWNALQPAVLEIPRIPTDLYYNVEDPSTWIPEYEALKSIDSIDYPTIIDQQSDALAGYMLAGNKDPWMFHQLNTYDYDGAGHSLLSDLLDATFAKYAAASTFPVSSPTEDELAAIFINRMTFQGSGAAATIQPGSSITVSVTNAATVPVTGLCTQGAESYGEQTISYLSLSAGQSVTLSLVGCNPGAGGTAGGGGAAGVGGAGTGGRPGGGRGPPPAGGAAGGVVVGGGGAAGAGGVVVDGGAGGSPANGGAGGAPATGIGGAGGAGEGSGTGGEPGAAGGRGGASGGAGAAGPGGLAGAGGRGGAGQAGVFTSEGGCNCEVGTTQRGSGALFLTLLGAALGIRPRRRR